jgi:hypothetical protein
MSKKRFSAEQVINNHREAQVLQAKGQSIVEACRHMGDHRADLLPVAEGVWRFTSGPGEAVEAVGAGKQSLEEGGGRPDCGQCDFEGGGVRETSELDRVRRSLTTRTKIAGRRNGSRRSWDTGSASGLRRHFAKMPLLLPLWSKK